MPVKVEIDVDDKTRINIKSELRFKDLITSIPGTRFDRKNNVWHLPVSWSACLALSNTFGASIEVGPELQAWSDNEHQNRIVPSYEYRTLTDLAEGDDDLYPHQRAGVKFLTTARQALLADQPGLGKSAQAIRAMDEVARSGGNPYPALVVCPNTLKTNWKREFEKWSPDTRVLVINGTSTQRRKQFEAVLNPLPGEEAPQVVIINWESLRSHTRLGFYGGIAFVRCVEHGGTDENISPARCEVHPGELNQIEFSTVIADEIHRSKDPKSKQTRALWGATGDAEYRFALTGTPLANNVLDLWSILHWLAPLEWPTKSRWMDRMVNSMENQYGGIHIIGVRPEMQEEFFATVNPRIRRMLKAIVLPWLPEVVTEIRTVEMGAKQKKAYNQMRDNFIAELDGGEFIVASSSLTKTTRLIQFASASAELVEDPATGEPKVRLSEPSATLDAVMTDLQSGDFGDDSIAISSVSSQLLNLLSARLNKANIEHGMITGDITPDMRQAHIDSFQAERTKVILFTVQAGGVGVTLTAARRLLRIQRPWSLVDDTQANDRVHRIGSEIHDSIIITDYVVSDTVQARVQEVLDEKGESFEEVVQDKEQLKAMLKQEAGSKKVTAVNKRKAGDAK